MTDEQINEAVHKARGYCWHKWRQLSFGFKDRECLRCGIHGTQEHDIDIIYGDNKPYTTDPRLWWPLAWDKQIVIIRDQIDRDSQEVNARLSVILGMTIIIVMNEEDVGRDVCLAYLTYKQGKDNIESDAV